MLPPCDTSPPQRFERLGLGTSGALFVHPTLFFNGGAWNFGLGGYSVEGLGDTSPPVASRVEAPVGA